MKALYKILIAVVLVGLLLSPVGQVSAKTPQEDSYSTCVGECKILSEKFWEKFAQNEHIWSIHFYRGDLYDMQVDWPREEMIFQVPMGSWTYVSDMNLWVRNRKGGNIQYFLPKIISDCEIPYYVPGNLVTLSLDEIDEEETYSTYMFDGSRMAYWTWSVRKTSSEALEFHATLDRATLIHQVESLPTSGIIYPDIETYDLSRGDKLTVVEVFKDTYPVTSEGCRQRDLEWLGELDVSRSDWGLRWVATSGFRMVDGDGNECLLSEKYFSSSYQEGEVLYIRSLPGDMEGRDRIWVDDAPPYVFLAYPDQKRIAYKNGTGEIEMSEGIVEEITDDTITISGEVVDLEGKFSPSVGTKVQWYTYTDKYLDYPEAVGRVQSLHDEQGRTWYFNVYYEHAETGGRPWGFYSKRYMEEFRVLNADESNLFVTAFEAGRLVSRTLRVVEIVNDEDREMGVWMSDDAQGEMIWVQMPPESSPPVGTIVGVSFYNDADYEFVPALVDDEMGIVWYFQYLFPPESTN